MAPDEPRVVVAPDPVRGNRPGDAVRGLAEVTGDQDRRAEVAPRELDSFLPTAVNVSGDRKSHVLTAGSVAPASCPGRWVDAIHDSLMSRREWAGRSRTIEIQDALGGAADISDADDEEMVVSEKEVLFPTVLSWME